MISEGKFKIIGTKKKIARNNNKQLFMIIFKQFPTSIFEFCKKQSFVLWSFTIFIVFNNFFEVILNKFVVKPFLSYIDQSIFNDFIFFLMLILIIVKIAKHSKLNYLISNTELLVSILAFPVFVYYRFFDSIWEFTPLKILPFLKYMDIVLLFLLGNVFIRLAYKTKNFANEPSKGFFFDNPITSNDLLNRNIVAESIASKIKNTSNPDSSFAIGITSEWGFGKTSFLNLIENNLKSNQQIIIHFNPWLNNDEKSIVNTFFDELSSKLKPYNKDLSIDLLRYAKTINSERISSLNSILSYVLHINDGLRDQFENINNAIRSSGFQIIVFIDDLDRLYETEILEVLRLIRNSANFSNTIFVVAYDRNYLISALNKANEYHPEFYLEKIFQLEIALPAFERLVIKNKLQEQILPTLTDEDKKKFEGILKYSEQSHSDPFRELYLHIQFLKNLRDVNRFTNSFIIAYETLKGEINLVDLMNLELLKMKYLGIYNLLVTKHQGFLERKAINGAPYLTLRKSSKETESNENNSKHSYDFDLNYKTELEEYLELNYKSVGIRKNQIDEVVSYVYAIFPHYSNFSSEKPELLSISNPISISRYFHYNLLSTDLSEIEFSKYRRKSEKEFQEKIKEWIEKGLKDEISDKLDNIIFFENREDYEKVIRTIFFFASFNIRDKKAPIGFDEKNLIEKLQFKKVKDFYKDKDEYHTFVVHVFKNQYSPYMFVSRFIDVIFETALPDWNFVLSVDELIENKTTYFEQYSVAAESFDIFIFWLFNYCHYKEYTKEGNSYYSQKSLPEKAKVIFKACATRLSSSFIKILISTDSPIPDQKKAYNILKSTTLLVWENWEDFEKFVWQLNETEVSGLKEFKEFFIQCKKFDFEKFIPFDFKEIDLSDALFLNR